MGSLLWEIHVFINSFKKHLMNIYYVPGTALGTRDIPVIQEDTAFLALTE